MKIAVVMLTYHGKQYLPDLFASLEKTQCAHPWELIVVDNASSDQDFLPLNVRGSERGLFVIRNATNLGFAAGNNVGIRKAIADGAEYIVLLNQDTVVEPNWLSELVRVAESDPKIGAVQARLMLWDKKDVINSIGNEIHFLGFGYAGGYGVAYNELHEARNPDFLPLNVRGSERGLYEICDITYASGAVVLYRTSALRDIGLLDESLFMYHEDLDLGWRLWRAGWRSVLAPEAVVYHKYEFSRSITKYYYMERNRFLVLLENYSFATLLLISPALFVMEIGLVAKAIVSGWGREKLRAYAYFLRPATWSMIVRERYKKQKKFRRPERELMRRFVGTIDFQDVRNPFLEYIANPIFNLYWQIIKRIIRW